MHTAELTKMSIIKLKHLTRFALIMTLLIRFKRKLFFHTCKMYTNLTIVFIVYYNNRLLLIISNIEF